MNDPRIITFAVPFDLSAKQSTRFTMRGGFPRRYTPKKIVNNASALARLIGRYVPDEPLNGPLRFEATVIYQWRKSASKTAKAKGRAWKDTLPDFDNLCKQLCDVLQSCGFYGNDSQIAEATIRKWWGDEGPMLYVLLEELR